MITISMSTVIDADRARVWRALTDPRELLGWDERIVEVIDVPSDFPKPGQHALLRCKLGGVPIVRHDRPLEVIPGERLYCSIQMGLFRFDATYTLGEEVRETGRTRLGIKLVTANEIPLFGGSLDRFAVRRLASEYVDTSLRALQQWCEHAPQATS